MKQSASSPNLDETRQETLLRATLYEHAPETVDIDGGWAAVAKRFPLSQQSQYSKRINFWHLRSNSQYKPGRRKTMLILVAVAGLSILLMGAGIASGMYFWGGDFGDPGIQQIGDQHLYKDIGQTQQVGPATITLTRGYADTGRTLIAYDVQLPASMLKDYNSFAILSYSLSDQSGEEPMAGNTQCTELPKDGSSMHCLMTSGPFHPTTVVSQLTVNWEITQITLIPSTDKPDNRITGHWHFQFSLPFYPDNRGSGGPYAQPTHIP